VSRLSAFFKTVYYVLTQPVYYLITLCSLLLMLNHNKSTVHTIIILYYIVGAKCVRPFLFAMNWRATAGRPYGLCEIFNIVSTANYYISTIRRDRARPCLQQISYEIKPTDSRIFQPSLCKGCGSPVETSAFNAEAPTEPAGETAGWREGTRRECKTYKLPCSAEGRGLLLSLE